MHFAAAAACIKLLELYAFFGISILLLACAMVNCKVDGMFDETLYVT
jgi:hypothetical protein